jgi:hypothetical protein
MISSEPRADFNKIAKINRHSLIFSDLKHHLHQVLGTEHSRGALWISGVDGCTESNL